MPHERLKRSQNSQIVNCPIVRYMHLYRDELLRQHFPAPRECVKWVKHCFLTKHEADLPPKTSLHPQGTDFFNTMPCLLPPEAHRYGVKVVHRIAGATPSLGGTILLFDSAKGTLLAQFDSDRITTMRTGAVAALSAMTFRKSNTLNYGFIGLGNTARATLLCLLDSEPTASHHITLLKYKDQAERFIERFASWENVEFHIVESAENVVRSSDAVFSCLTDAESLLCPNEDCFHEGCTIIPVHTKGFQNCDLFFDSVFADDRAHVSGFRYFDRFHRFAEMGDVLRGKAQGRQSDTERILCYNSGIALHDIYFAHQLHQKLKEQAPIIDMGGTKPKFYI